MARPTRFERLSDDALVAAMAVGEPDAATVFVRRFERRVVGLAVTVVRDRSLAEDVAQQAFVRAWRYAGSFDAGRGSVLTWLLRITRNQALDALAARRPEPVAPDTLADALTADAGAGPEARAVVGTEISRLREGLAMIPVEQRRAVVLAAIGGRTMAEIAAVEGVPVPTAKTRVRLGMRRLRAAMIEAGS
jgi:RNA polymerase sigma-70 factor (ECF subfamily)